MEKVFLERIENIKGTGVSAGTAGYQHFFFSQRHLQNHTLFGSFKTVFVFRKGIKHVFVNMFLVLKYLNPFFCQTQGKYHRI